MYLFAPMLNDTIQNNTTEQLMHNTVVNEDDAELTASQTISNRNLAN